MNDEIKALYKELVEAGLFGYQWRNLAVGLGNGYLIDIGATPLHGFGLLNTEVPTFTRSAQVDHYGSRVQLFAHDLTAETVYLIMQQLFEAIVVGGQWSEYHLPKDLGVKPEPKRLEDWFKSKQSD